MLLKSEHGVRGHALARDWSRCSVGRGRLVEWAVEHCAERESRRGCRPWLREPLPGGNQRSFISALICPLNRNAENGGDDAHQLVCSKTSAAAAHGATISGGQKWRFRDAMIKCYDWGTPVGSGFA